MSGVREVTDRRLKRFHGCLGLLLPVLMLLQHASPVAAEEAFLTPSVTAADLEKRQQAGEHLLVVDVRGQPEYRSGHVPGAVNISPEQLTKHLEELRAADGIILYCSNGHRTRTAEKTLIENHVENLFHLEGGVFGWKTAGHALKTGWGP